jgi:integration host factor subunit alpha
LQSFDIDAFIATGYRFPNNWGRVTVAETITRAQLTEAVYQEVGLSRNESAELVESVLAEVSEALVRGEMVKLSSFGSFSVRSKGQRMGRNPKTGDEVPILPRRVLVFRPSHVLKKSINDTLVEGAVGTSGGEDTTSTPPDSTP